jgi:hypothetical protein
MTAVEVLNRLRRVLLALATMLLLGTLVELWLVNHNEDAIQWVPFVLCGLGLVAILLYVLRKTQTTIWFLRIVMTLMMLGSVLGIYLHVSKNMSLEREMHPTASSSQVWRKGFGGANPLLAPGILAISAILILLASYKYDVVNGSPASSELRSA